MFFLIADTSRMLVAHHTMGAKIGKLIDELETGEASEADCNTRADEKRAEQQSSKRRKTDPTPASAKTPLPTGRDRVGTR